MSAVLAGTKETNGPCPQRAKQLPGQKQKEQPGERNEE
jgi:hypothetical protein